MHAKSQSTTILVLGICSLVVCGLLGPVAWSMGKSEIARIDRGELPEDGRAQTQAGLVCGVIATICMIVGAIFLLFFVVGA